MAKEKIQPHRILREIFRHYIEYRDYVTSPVKSSSDQAKVSQINAMDGVIEHGYFIHDEDGVITEKILVVISFWDLHGALKKLSARKREAVFWNVILDKKQKDVAKIMGITTVSVGQYVEQAMLQLSEDYFAEELSNVKTSEVTHEPSVPQRSGTVQAI